MRASKAEQRERFEANRAYWQAVADAQGWTLLSNTQQFNATFRLPSGETRQVTAAERDRLMKSRRRR
jgi:hypothetical protein